MADNEIIDESLNENINESKNLLRILYFYKILWEHTDGEHGLKRTEIEEMLKEYGVGVQRKTVYEYIKLLKEFGVKIDTEENNNHRYCLLERTFNIMELRLLADAVASSRFLTEDGATKLIDKLKTLCSKYDAQTLGNYVYTANREITDDKDIWNINQIHKAISMKRKIKFRYMDYDIHLERKPREGERVCSPYALTWNEEKYYLIAHYEKYNSIVNFRVDRMESIEVLEGKKDPPRVEPPSDFNLAKYMSSTFSMFGGTEEVVTLLFDIKLLNPVIDRFGKSIELYPEGDTHFTVKVPIRTETPAPFFAWLLQFGDKARILNPPELKDKYVEMLNNTAASYSNSSD